MGFRRDIYRTLSTLKGATRNGPPFKVPRDSWFLEDGRGRGFNPRHCDSYSRGGYFSFFLWYGGSATEASLGGGGVMRSYSWASDGIYTGLFLP